MACLAVAGCAGTLRQLDLSRNQLTSLAGLGACTALRVLDVSRNQLTGLAGLAGCGRLAALDDTDRLAASVALRPGIGGRAAAVLMLIGEVYRESLAAALPSTLSVSRATTDRVTCSATQDSQLP